MKCSEQVRIISYLQIIHTCIKCQGNPFTLLKRIISLPVFNLRIITLVNPCQHLHFSLGKSFRLS